MLPPDCQAFRERALEASFEEPTHAADGVFGGRMFGGRVVGGAAHAAGCEACAEWAGRTRLTRGLVSSLERLVAPEELGARVTEELRGFPLRFAIACEQLPRPTAPALLDELVARRIEAQARVTERAELDLWNAEAADAPRSVREDEAQEGTDSLAVRALRTLRPVDAPDVLDRLVAEEIALGARADVERSVGELERLRAPSGLSRRVLGPFTRSDVEGRRWSTALAGLAAAGLLWIGGAATSWFGLAPDAPQVTSTDLVAALDDPLAGFAGRLAARELHAPSGRRAEERPFHLVASLAELGADPTLAAFAGASTSVPPIRVTPPVPKDLLAPRPFDGAGSPAHEGSNERAADAPRRADAVREDRRGEDDR